MARRPRARRAGRCDGVCAVGAVVSVALAGLLRGVNLAGCGRLASRLRRWRGVVGTGVPVSRGGTGTPCGGTSCAEAPWPPLSLLRVTGGAAITAVVR